MVVHVKLQTSPGKHRVRRHHPDAYSHQCIRLLDQCRMAQAFLQLLGNRCVMSAQLGLSDWA